VVLLALLGLFLLITIKEAPLSRTSTKQQSQDEFGR
jgi:hypothetical protein